MLKAKLKAENKSFNWLLKKLQESGNPISRSAFYRKLNGVSQFNQREINIIAKIINLKEIEIIDIFFNDFVSFRKQKNEREQFYD